MRALVLFLLIANVALYLWVRHENLSEMSQLDILPPEIGKLRLRNEPAVIAPRDQATASVEPGVLGEPFPEEPVLETATDLVATGESEPSPAGAPRVDQSSGRAVPETIAESPVSVGASPLALSQSVNDVTAPTARCARIGPLKPDEADDLVRNLPARFALLSDTSSEQRVANGYYVLVPALPSRAEGLRMLDELRSAGFKDVWLFRGGEFRNAISLGLFSNAAGAQRHAQDVAKKGFDVDVREKTTLALRRWLVVQHLGEDDLNEAIPLPRSTRVTSHSCP